MDEIWGPILGSLGFTALIITPFIVNKIIKFKLEIARINAETALKAEEVRAKNKLEIEKLIIQEGDLHLSENQVNESRFSVNDELEENSHRIRRRL